MPIQFGSEPLDSFTSSASPNKFKFDATKSDSFIKEAKQKYDTLHDRILTLAQNKTINDQPVILMILNTFPDVTAEELNGVGEALIRIAQLYKPHKDLKEQLSIIKYVRENPLLIATIFGEFDFDSMESFSSDI